MRTARTGVGFAVADGLQAARDGWGPETCPHQPGTVCHRWWLEAFWSVRVHLEPREEPFGYRRRPDLERAN